MSQTLPAEIATDAALAAIRIVLVAPAGPLNVGAVARVMKNFGLSQLVLVNPQCDPLGTEAMQMAVHAKDVLQAAQQVRSIPEALTGCSQAIATTARARGFNAPLELPEIALPQLLSSQSICDPKEDAPMSTAHAGECNLNTALIFGPEDRGLSNEELIYAQRFTKIPTHPGYSALNLAQAVAICCYELYRDRSGTLLTSPLSAKQTESTLPHSASQSTSHNAAKLNELEGYYQHLEAVLLKVEYLYPHTAASRMRKFRQLLHRAAPTSSEVALLRGILRQMEWALSDSKQG